MARSSQVQMEHVHGEQACISLLVRVFNKHNLKAPGSQPLWRGTSRSPFSRDAHGARRGNDFVLETI